MGNFNLLEARPMKIDKTTTNANMEPIRLSEERIYTRLNIWKKIRMESQQTDTDTKN